MTAIKSLFARANDGAFGFCIKGLAALVLAGLATGFLVWLLRLLAACLSAAGSHSIQ